MNHIPLVRIAQPLAHLDDDVRLIQETQLPARCQRRLQILAFQILHDQIRVPVNIAQVVHSHNVGMNQAGQRLGLNEKPLQQRRILREPAGDHLDGDGSIKVGIVGLVHHAHAAASNDVDNVIFPDLCGQIGSHDVPGPNRGSIPLLARHHAKTPGKGGSASLSRRPRRRLLCYEPRPVATSMVTPPSRRLSGGRPCPPRRGRGRPRDSRQDAGATVKPRTVMITMLAGKRCQPRPLCDLCGSSP